MFSKSLHEIEVVAICFVMEYGLEYNTCACGMNSKSKDFEYVGSFTSSFPTFQGKIKVINSVSRVIIGQRNINISKESNCHFTPFSSFWCGDLHLCGKKPALDTWKIVARALFKLVWKVPNPDCGHLCDHDSWCFEDFEEKVFFNQNFAKFCFNRTRHGNVPPLRWLFFRSTEWELGPFCYSTLIPKVCIEFRWF